MPSPTTVTLNDGKAMPLLGLGTWQSPPGQVYQAVLDAIVAGYRHLDCAYVYQNETEIGQALKEAFSKGMVTRDQLFITSKCWLTFFSRERVEKCLQRSLERLGLDYLDLYLIHWPVGFRDDDDSLFPENGDGLIALNEVVDFTNSWLGMEDVQKKGLVKSIGISNFNIDQMTRLLAAATVKPAVNQVELHPMLVQKELVEFCRVQNIILTAYCPLGSSPPAATGHSGLPADRPSLMDNELVKKVANSLGRTPAQVLIRYHIQRGIVCIPKSVTKERIVSNADVFSFELSNDHLAQLETLNNGYRFCRFNVQGIGDHADYPFKEQ